MDISAFFGLFVIALIASAILHFEGVLKKKHHAVIAVVFIILAMGLRGYFMDYKTLDYQHFLSVWVQYFRDHGGLAALKENIGNYNVPYLYFLSLFSYSKVSDLYLIKLLSIFFDVILAWGVMRIVGIFHPKTRVVLPAFLGTLFLPTVVLNGAVWGQCDSIYTAFAVWSIYFAMTDRSALSMVAIAFSFAFKLQAVFVMPVFLIFIFAGRVKWYHLPLFPVAYVAICLPAIIAGRPVLDTLMLYFNQAGTVGSGLNYNSSSVYSFFRDVPNEALASTIGIAAAFLFLMFIFVWAFNHRRNMGHGTLLALTLLISIGVPFLLPHMHDRYFFMGDIFSYIFCFAAPYLFVCAPCVSFASLLGYHAYLKLRYLYPMRYGAIALIAAMLLLIFYILIRGERVPESKKKNSDRRTRKT